MEDLQVIMVAIVVTSKKTVCLDFTSLQAINNKKRAPGQQQTTTYHDHPVQYTTPLDRFSILHRLHHITLYHISHTGYTMSYILTHY